MFRQLREDIVSVFARDPAARSFWEVLTCYPGIHAILIHRVSHRLWQWRLFWLARMSAHFGRSMTGIEIHPAAVIGRRFFIDHGMGVVIGANSVVGSDVEAYTIAAGNPAKPLRKRFDDELIALLEAFKWWDKPVAEIQALIPLLSGSDLEQLKNSLKQRLAR